MVRLFFAFFSFLMLYGCYIVKSYNYKKCVDDSTYQKIDTTAIYLSCGKTDSISIFLKFYEKGNVTMFYGSSGKNKSKGRYCINKNESKMKFFYKHPQGNFWSKKELTIRGDTIISYTLPSPQGIGGYDTYVKSKNITIKED